MSAPDRFVDAIRQVLATRERERAPVHTIRVLGRNADGTLLKQRLDAECVSRGEPGNQYQGQTLTQPAGAGRAFNLRGTSGVSPVSGQTADATLWVERLEPDTYRPGEAYDVTVFGRGFDSLVRIEFLRPGLLEEINADITIVSTTFVDESQLALEIEVAPDAVFYELAPISYGREAP